MPARAELVRFAYLSECTLGWLHYKGLRIATIERQWIPSPEHRGGLNAQSCVPDGAYRLVRHDTARFPDCWALVNPELDVRRQSSEPGRTAILIHAGNRVRDVIGCIAVGLTHGWLEGEHSVLSSQTAMGKIRAAFSPGLPSLFIRPTAGTTE